MERRINPFDPLGILSAVKHDVDRIGSSVLTVPLPGPPGMARRTEEERAARHGVASTAELPPRGTGFKRLLDPLGLTGSKGMIGNPIPVEYDGHLVDMKQQARGKLISVGYSSNIVDKALNWYDEWLMGMARRLAPADTNLQREVVQAAYAEIAPRAERWIRGIQEAFGPPVAA